MADENRVIKNRCPDCGGMATHPRYNAHPVASHLRNVAYWSVPKNQAQ